MSVLVSVTTCHHPRCTNNCPEGHVCCSEECARDLQALGMVKSRYYGIKRDIKDCASKLNRAMSVRVPDQSRVAKLKDELARLKAFAEEYHQQLLESGIEF